MPTLQLSVRVPGSTSNLGPGFDLLGLALDLYLEVQATAAPDGQAQRVVELRGEAQHLDDPSLLLRAFEQGARLAGAPSLPPFEFRMDSALPLARGLGSSGAACAAGLLLGAAAAQRAGAAPPGDLDQRLLEAGCELEGHPDNVAASLAGGLTLAAPTERGLRLLSPSLHPDLAFAVAWGSTPLETSRARAALPASVPFTDAVENPRRLALLLEGLARADGELLSLAQEERLHVRHRLPLIPGGAQALQAAREAGAWLATISGAGSSLLAIAPAGCVEAVARALGESLERADGPATWRVVEPALQAPVVRVQELPS